MESTRLQLGVRSLDTLLGGGIDLASVTEFYGEGGAGKTNLCLQLVCEVARQGRWTLYMDTEGVSIDRLLQIAEARQLNASQVLGRLLIDTPTTLEQQETVVERAAGMMRERAGKLGLVVVDSVATLYRLALGQAEEEAARQSLSAQVATLLHAALETSLPVVITNQVWRDIHSSTFEPIGGSFLNHVAKTIVRIDRLKDGWRRATLMKHRSQPEGGTADFRITQRGLE